MNVETTVREPTARVDSGAEQVSRRPWRFAVERLGQRCPDKDVLAARSASTFGSRCDCRRRTTLQVVELRPGCAQAVFRTLFSLRAHNSPKPTRSHSRELFSSERFSTGIIGPVQMRLVRRSCLP